MLKILYKPCVCIVQLEHINNDKDKTGRENTERATTRQLESIETSQETI